MSSRAASRLASHFSRTARTGFSRKTLGRRFQTTDATAAPSQSTIQRLWNSPVGVKTWALVLAGISDFTRPAETLSLTQNLALMGTGAIWTRWCFVIKPRNILLAAVNFLLGCVGVTQVTRIFLYQRSLNDETTPEVAQKNAKDVADTARGVVTDPEGAAKKAELQ
ncbi:MAG: hypothetical protein Q9195_002628 [Heterodermia aff. obscurata]